MAPNSSLSSLLIVGAGELGLAMLAAFHEHASTWQISVLLRPSTIASAEKRTLLARIRSLGGTPIPGDYEEDSEDMLVHAFTAFSTVVVCSGFTHGASGLQAKITRAVLAAGVRRYVPWQFGVDYDVLGRGSSQDSFDEQLAVRALLRGQNATQWTIVSVGIFMSFLFEPWWGVVDREHDIVRALGSWENCITTTDVADIGPCTVDVLSSNESAVDNAVVFVAGETLTYEQLARSVEKGLGREMRRELWDMQHLLAELDKDPSNGLKKYRPIFAGSKGIAWDFDKSWNKTRGIETMSTEGYARRLRVYEQA